MRKINILITVIVFASDKKFHQKSTNWKKKGGSITSKNEHILIVKLMLVVSLTIQSCKWTKSFMCLFVTKKEWIKISAKYINICVYASTTKVETRFNSCLLVFC